MNQPQFKIHGQERREFKKKYFELRSFVRNFWHYHTLDKDMAMITGSESKDYPMSDEKAQKIFEKESAKLKEMELKLNEPYNL